jgi:hypothetical protein
MGNEGQFAVLGSGSFACRSLRLGIRYGTIAPLLTHVVFHKSAPASRC